MTYSPVTTEWLALPADIRSAAETAVGHLRPLTHAETLLIVGRAIKAERELTALAEEAEWAAKECLWFIYDDYVAIGGTKKPTYGADLWQPIETAPKDGSVFLAATTRAQRPTACMCKVESGKFLVLSNGEKFEGQGWAQWWPTHWQPLPPSPKLAAVSEGGEDE